MLSVILLINIVVIGLGCVCALFAARVAYRSRLTLGLGWTSAFIGAAACIGICFLVPVLQMKAWEGFLILAIAGCAAGLVIGVMWPKRSSGNKSADSGTRFL